MTTTRVTEAHTDPILDKFLDKFLHPMSAADQTYGFIIERAKAVPGNKTSATEIVTSGDAYDAMHTAYKMARPGEGDVLIILWVNEAGEHREFSTKVLVRK